MPFGKIAARIPGRPLAARAHGGSRAAAFGPGSSPVGTSGGGGRTVPAHCGSPLGGRGGRPRPRSTGPDGFTLVVGSDYLRRGTDAERGGPGRAGSFRPRSLPSRDRSLEARFEPQGIGMTSRPPPVPFDWEGLLDRLSTLYGPETGAGPTSRDHAQNPFQVLIGTILSQRTRDANTDVCERQTVRPLPGRRLPGLGEVVRGRAAHPGHRFLPREDAGGAGVLEGGARSFRRCRTPHVRGAHVPPRGRPEDRQLCARVRLRNSRHPRRHPCSSHREPPRRGAHPHPGRDGGRAAGAGRPALLDPGQSAPGPARPEPVPTEPPALPAVSHRRPVRDRARAQRRAEPSATGGPASAEGVAGKNAIATRVTSTRRARTSQPTA